MFDHLPVLIQVDRADADNMVRVLIDIRNIQLRIHRRGHGGS